MFNELEREIFKLESETQIRLGTLRNKLEKMLNEAYNIGYIEGHYKGLSEGRGEHDQKNSAN